MRRVHIIGRKNHGKTTLVVALTAELTRRGYRVGTIKHTSHRHELDVPGKDSFLHREAGGDPAAILSKGMAAVFLPEPAGLSDSERYDRLVPMFADCDLVLVEGHSGATGLRLEVWRHGLATTPIATTDPGVRAVISDDALDPATERWPRTPIDQLADRILDLLAISRPAT